MQTATVRTIRREVLIVLVSAALAAGIVRAMVYAGSLTPSASPAGTMKSLADIYTPIAGTYDASAVTASPTGNAIQIARCAVRKVQGQTCP